MNNNIFNKIIKRDSEFDQLKVLNNPKSILELTKSKLAEFNLIPQDPIWIGNNEFLLVQNEDRFKKYLSRNQEYLANIPKDLSLLADTKIDEFIGLFEIPNSKNKFAIIINISPLLDTSGMFLPIFFDKNGDIAEFLQRSNYYNKEILESMLWFSSNGYVLTSNGSTPSVKSAHIQYASETVNNINLPIVNIIENNDFDENNIYIKINKKTISIPVFISSNTDIILDKLNEIYKNNFSCDLLFIKGKIIIFKRPNSDDPQDCNIHYFSNYTNWIWRPSCIEAIGCTLKPDFVSIDRENSKVFVNDINKIEMTNDDFIEEMWSKFGKLNLEV